MNAKDVIALISLLLLFIPGSLFTGANGGYTFPWVHQAAEVYTTVTAAGTEVAESTMLSTYMTTSNGQTFAVTQSTEITYTSTSQVQSTSTTYAPTTSTTQTSSTQSSTSSSSTTSTAVSTSHCVHCGGALIPIESGAQGLYLVSINGQAYQLTPQAVIVYLLLPMILLLLIAWSKRRRH